METKGRKWFDTSFVLLTLNDGSDPGLELEAQFAYANNNSGTVKFTKINIESLAGRAASGDPGEYSTIQ